MDPIEYVKSRSKEVSIIEKDIIDSKNSLSKQPFQRIPRFLRRRAASHNSKRIPARFRIHNISTVQKVNKNKNHRQKPHSQVKRLVTHNWHAKRCSMDEYYGFKIPIYTNEKLSTALYNALNSRMIIYDMSYYSNFIIHNHHVPNKFNESLQEMEWKYFSSLETCPFILSKGATMSHIFVHPGYNFDSSSFEAVRTTEKAIFLAFGKKCSEVLKDAADLFSIEASCNSDCSLILIDRCSAYNFWKFCISRGSLYCGLKEFQQICLEVSLYMEPFDCAGFCSLKLLFTEFESHYSRIFQSLPKNKIDTVSYVAKKERLQYLLLFIQNQTYYHVYKYCLIKKGSINLFALVESVDGQIIGFISQSSYLRSKGRVGGHLVSFKQLESNNDYKICTNDGSIRLIRLLDQIK